MSTSSPEQQARALSAREWQALTTMLERGACSDDQSPVTAADRSRWLAQVPETLVGGSCGCGTCPSIELINAKGWTPRTGDVRVVLEAEGPDALLLLFIDDDRLSYLELAPLSDSSITSFPDSRDIHTA